MEKTAVAPLLGSLRDAQRLFSDDTKGSPYLRGGHLGLERLEDACAQREGGKAALTVASGQAANHLVFSTLLRPGDHIVASFRLFGGTWSLLEDHFSRELGVRVSWFDPADPMGPSRFFLPSTKLLFVESLSNPDGVIPDFEQLSRIAQEHRVPFVVDNTLGFGLCEPLRHGASVVTVSLTKYANGHNSAIAGAIVDGQTFPWRHDPRFPSLTSSLGEQAPSLWDRFGLAAFSIAVRKRSVVLGPTISLETAHTVMHNLQTLENRWSSHLKNAEKVARFLKSHPKVESLRYPKHDGDLSNADRADRYCGGACGGIILLKLKGGEEAVSTLLDRLGRMAHRANLGQAQTIITAPYHTTHRQLDPRHKEAMGITPSSIRLSVGIEPSEDLLQDLSFALGE